MIVQLFSNRPFPLNLIAKEIEEVKKVCHTCRMRKFLCPRQHWWQESHEKSRSQMHYFGSHPQ